MKRMLLEIESANFVLGLTAVERLPDVAAQALSEGYDSPGLRRLAGLTDFNAAEEALRLFKQSLLQVGIPLPDKREAVLLLARETAAKVLCGEFSPYEGGKRIWQLTLVAGGVAPELDPFIYASSEWEERPKDRALFERAIREAAKNLVGDS